MYKITIEVDTSAGMLKYTSKLLTEKEFIQLNDLQYISKLETIVLPLANNNTVSINPAKIIAIHFKEQ